MAGMSLLGRGQADVSMVWRQTFCYVQAAPAAAGAADGGTAGRLPDKPSIGNAECREHHS